MSEIVTGFAEFICAVSAVVAVDAAAFGVLWLALGNRRQRLLAAAIVLAVVAWSVLRVAGVT